MSNVESHIATPEKRVAAALIDIFLVMLIALLIHLGGNELGYQSDFATLVALTYFLYHVGFLQIWEGQSPGRRTMDISVISARGGPLGFPQAVLRSALRPACCFIVIGGSDDLGVIHAHPLTTAIMVFAEFLLLGFVPLRRTAADLVSWTIVVNTPPPQPYRAPAGPMYSSTDAEFGYPPRKRPGDRGDNRRSILDHSGGGNQESTTIHDQSTP